MNQANVANNFESSRPTSNQRRIRNQVRHDRTDTRSSVRPTTTRNSFTTNQGIAARDTRAPYRIAEERFAADTSRPTVADNFNQQYQQSGIRNQQTERGQRDARKVLVKSPQRRPRQPQNSPETRTEFDGVETNSDESDGVATRKKVWQARAVVKNINKVLFPIFTIVWLSIQVPLALFALMLIAVSAASQAALSGSLVARAAEWLGTVVNYFVPIGPLAGFSISALDAPGAAILMLIFFLGLMQFLTMVFWYLLGGIATGIRPIFGQGILFKLSSLLLVGLYMIPLINLLPLHMPYMWVMRRYPK